jgi:hypothetical protein
MEPMATTAKQKANPPILTVSHIISMQHYKIYIHKLFFP